MIGSGLPGCHLGVARHAPAEHAWLALRAGLQASTRAACRAVCQGMDGAVAGAPALPLLMATGGKRAAASSGRGAGIFRQLPPAFASALGGIHRLIGLLQQHVGAECRGRVKQGDADAG